MLKGVSALVTPFVQMSPFHVPVGCNFFFFFWRFWFAPCSVGGFGRGVEGLGVQCVASTVMTGRWLDDVWHYINDDSILCVAGLGHYLD
jgi:hypothetical protein